MQGPRDARHAKAAIGQPFFVDDGQANDFGNADGGHGQIVGLQSHADTGDHPADDARCDAGAYQADDDRQVESADMGIGTRRRQNRAGIGANSIEAGDAGVEQAAEAPLHVECQAQDGIDPAHGEEGHGVKEDAAQIHQIILPLNRPCGLKIRISTMITKATAVL